MMGYQDKGMEMTVFLTNKDMEKILSEMIEGPLETRIDDKKIFTKLFVKVDNDAAVNKLLGVTVDNYRNYNVAISDEYYIDLNEKGFYPKIRYWGGGPTITMMKESYAENNIDYRTELYLTKSAFRRAGLIP